MKDKILWQMMDSLRGWSPLSEGATLELVLKILAWARLSGDPAAYPTKPGLIREALVASGFDETLLRQAFPDDPHLERLDSARLRLAFDLALRLRDTGMLQAFDPADALAALSSGYGVESALPPEVATLLVGLAEISPDDAVYTPWDFGGQLASRCADCAGTVYLETPQVSAIPAIISLLSSKPFPVHHADPVRAPSAVEAGAAAV